MMNVSPQIKQATNKIWEALKLLDEETQENATFSLAAAHLQAAFDLVVDRASAEMSH